MKLLYFTLIISFFGFPAYAADLDINTKVSLKTVCDTEKIPDNTFRNRNQALCAEAERVTEDVKIPLVIVCLNEQVQQVEEVCPKSFLGKYDFPDTPYGPENRIVLPSRFEMPFEQIHGTSLAIGGTTELPKAMQNRLYNQKVVEKLCTSEENTFWLTDRILCSPFINDLPIEDPVHFRPIRMGDNIELMPLDIETPSTTGIVFYGIGQRYEVGTDKGYTWSQVEGFVRSAVENYKTKLEEKGLIAQYGTIVVENISVTAYSDQTGNSAENGRIGRDRARLAAARFMNYFSNLGILVPDNKVSHAYGGNYSNYCVERDQYCTSHDWYWGNDGRQYCRGGTWEWYDKKNQSCLADSRRASWQFTLGFQFHSQAQQRQN